MPIRRAIFRFSPGFGALVVSASLTAQTAPKFSGTWVIDQDKTAARSGGSAAGVTNKAAGDARAAAGRGVMVAEWTITQTPASLTIEHPLAGGTVQKFVYKLDGSE